jgi:hypothetical protein
MKQDGSLNVHSDDSATTLSDDTLLMDEKEKVACPRQFASHFASDKKRNNMRPPWTFIAVFLLNMLMCGPVAGVADPDDLASIRSVPPDTTPYTRPEVPEDHWVVGREGVLSGAIPPTIVGVRIVNVVVNNTDAGLLFTDTFNDGETSIAVNPLNPDEIVITAFSGTSGGKAALWHSLDGGQIWTKEFSIPPAPGVPGFFACGGPCDQTIDYGRRNELSGTILGAGTNGVTGLDVYSGTTTGPTNAEAWNWLAPGGITQKTNHNAPSTLGSADQPWLVVNRDPQARHQNNVYVAYDDFRGAPDMRVAVAQGTNPPDFILDQRTGFSTGFVNPGHRLAADPREGSIYSLFQRRIAPGVGGSQNINYMLNRSINGGRSWSLNGSSTGIVIANADSTQPQPKFGTVNALLGGVLHAAADPHSGDLFYVYGRRDPATGNNRLAIRRIVDGGVGDVIIGPERFITGQVQAAIPSVAVTEGGTVGIFYYTFDGFSGGFPVFTAHLTVTDDLGQTFTDLGLLTFLSSAADNGDPRQRVLGDYMQLKAVGDTFYGAFTGNGVAFGRPFANHDPIFFRVSVRGWRSGNSLP